MEYTSNVFKTNYLSHQKKKKLSKQQQKKKTE